MFKIRTNRGEVFDADGQSILEALQHNNVYLPVSCGGKGSCGRCKVRILKGKVSSRSYFGVTEIEKKEGYILACQSYPEEDILVEIPQRLITVSERISKVKADIVRKIFSKNAQLFQPLVMRLNLSVTPPTIEDSRADFDRLLETIGKKLKITRKDAEQLSDYLRQKRWSINLAVQDDEIISFLEPEKKIYALALDIGTTTVALALIDMEKGEIIDVASCYNSQIAYGDDVITRIVYAIENPKGLENLRKSIVNDINALINTLFIRHKDGEILYVVISGNTTMCHFFWGLNPKYIREEPYVPVFNHYPLWRASDGRVNLKNNVPLHTVPSVAGYVGGDIVSGVLATEIYKDEEIGLFIDIGTNGEIVIGNKDWLVTASTSAGPCFEGSGISCGMRATEGAIEAFSFDREKDTFEIKVIGDVAPIGICGSGMIDIVSELFKSGIIDQKGRLLKDSSKYVDIVEGELRFLIIENCYISQSDIDNIIRAKAAIYAGILTVLQEVGINENDISKVYLAGGFGEFLDVKKAIEIGMLPNISYDRFIFLGNTSLTGAILCLLSRELKNKAEEIAYKMTYLDLSHSKLFMDEYVSALFLPHTDIERFKIRSD